MNDIHQDLTQKLIKKKPVPVQKDTALSQSQARNTTMKTGENYVGRISEKQSVKWQRAGKYKVEGVPAELLGETERKAPSPAELEEMKRLQEDLLLTTFVSGIFGTLATAAAYGDGPAASFGIGSVASLIYVQLLANTVNAIATDDVESRISGTTGGLRLIIPALLAAVISKNHDFVEKQYGLDLSIIGLCAGFYINKVGQLSELVKAILPEKKKLE